MVKCEKPKIGDFGDSIRLRELLSKAKRVQTENSIGPELRNRRNEPPANLWQQYMSGDSDDFKLMNF